MAALGVSVKKSIGKGKGLFADVQFGEGDVIFTEKPLVCCQFSWNKAYQYKACEYCMKSMETAEESCRRLAQDETIVLPHKECCTVDKKEHSKCELCATEYCSSHCKQKAAEEYHGMICLSDTNPIKQELEALEDMWRQIHFPPESANIMLVVRMIALVKQSFDKDKIIKAMDGFCCETSIDHDKIVHKLLGSKFYEQINSLRLQLRSTVREDRLEHWYTKDGFHAILAMLGTNQQGIGSSSLSIWVKNCENLDMSEEARSKFDDFVSDLYEKLLCNAGEFLDCDGVGLYSLQSCANHSCVPNAEVAFEHGNNRLTLRAIRSIDKGDEIYISYICGNALNRSRHSRQKFLTENYLFTCNCVKCDEQVNDPDFTSDDSSEGSLSESDSDQSDGHD